MEIRPHRIIKRKKTREIKVGKIPVGGNSDKRSVNDKYFNN